MPGRTFKNAVACELIEHNGVVNHARYLLMIRNDATNEMWIRLAESVHEIVELLAVLEADGHERSTFLNRCARVRCEEVLDT